MLLIKDQQMYSLTEQIHHLRNQVHQHSLGVQRGDSPGETQLKNEVNIMKDQLLKEQVLNQYL